MEKITYGPRNGRYVIRKDNKSREGKVYIRDSYHGAGLFKDRWERLYHAIVIGPRSNYSPSMRRWIDHHKERRIVSVSAERKPIVKAIDILINLISLGLFNKAKRSVSQDTLFHLYTVLTLDDGTRWKVEKNHVIQALPFTHSDNENIPAKLPPEPITVGELFTKAPLQDGKNFFIYNAAKYNCQRFTSTLFTTCKVWTVISDKFINQPTEEIIAHLPQYVTNILQATTNLANRLNVAYEGAGLSSIKPYASKKVDKQEYIKASEKLYNYYQTGQLIRYKKQLKKMDEKFGEGDHYRNYLRIMEHLQPIQFDIHGNGFRKKVFTWGNLLPY